MDKNYLIKREFFVLSKDGQVLEHYEFLKQVGKGAYGKVYLARLKVFPHFLRAIKVISKKTIRNPTIILNQIRVMGRMDHPHIVKIYQTFEDDKNLFLVLDYCSGTELYERLGNCQTFSQKKARHLFKQMVFAVNYLHSLKVCHRDLKLQNFMMESQKSWQIRLIDFGLSFRWKKDMREEISIKQQKKIVGTCYYVAPEVLTFNYDQRCDIWSLGVILYMMTTGTPPFDGKKEKEILENIRKMKYSLKNPECQQLSPLLLNLISRLLSSEHERISLQQVMNHPWMVIPDETKEIPLKIEFERLKTFSYFSKMKKIVATYISTHFSQSQMAVMRKVFEKIDKNNDGYLTFQQLKRYFQNEKDIQIPFQEVQKLMGSVDLDNNGKINYNQFITSCLDDSILSNCDYLQYVFNSFDLNRDGRIQRQEFSVILKAYSNEFRCNMDLVEELLKENDKNRDGVIDFNEFVESIKYIKRQPPTSNGTSLHKEKIQSE